MILIGQRDAQLLKNSMQSEIHEQQTHARTQHAQDAKSISDLELQITDLEEQLQQSIQLRKQ